jgi:hypothetical protein
LGVLAIERPGPTPYRWRSFDDDSASPIDSEWERYAELTPLEELLATFSLPSVTEWPEVQLKAEELRADLVNTHAQSGWQVSAVPFPLAVHVVQEDLLTHSFHWVPSLGEALRFKIVHLPRDAPVVRYLAESGRLGIRVEFEPHEDTEEGKPVRLLRVANRTMTLGLGSDAPETEVSRPGSLEEALD